ncbi:MAG: hypothetical protein F6J97_02210 [Leptolyngbya sp. SIO4C1]|nr:hypothetical protein [Leptolyngbya sp. SIO4C1]
MSLQALSLSPSSPTDRLLIMLHGWGANAQDVAGLMPYLDLSNYQILLPNGPYPHPMAPGGRMWYAFPTNYDFHAVYNFEQQADLQNSRQLLTQWLQSLPATTGIPLEKTVLAGFSQGGAMTLDVGLTLPLAGMIVLSGYCHAPLQQPLSQRPVLVIHGRQDAVVSIDKAHETKQNLIACGITPSYHEFEMGHEVSPEALAVVGKFGQMLAI